MERLKNMSLKKSFFLLTLCCLLCSLLLAAAVWMACSAVSSRFPSGGIALNPDGTVTVLEQPTPKQRRLASALAYLRILSCFLLPSCALAAAAILFYRLKLQRAISVLQSGAERIRQHDLNFFIPAVSSDELGQVCAAFEQMRAELLKSNRELWRQSEERRRLNAAFSHDLRNPVTVLKGTVKLLRKNIHDEQALDRMESYVARIESYVEAMSSVQRLEQLPVRTAPCSLSTLERELSDTAQLFEHASKLTVHVQTIPPQDAPFGMPDCASAPDIRTVFADHGILLTVAENLISNAARFARSRLTVSLAVREDRLILTVWDDGPGFPPALIQNGPKPFGRLAEDDGHFGMGLYTSQMLCIRHGGCLTLENASSGGAVAVASFVTSQPCG